MNDEEKKELQELIRLLYNDNLTQYGKRKLESYIKKQQQEIQDLENTIDRILDEQVEREKYIHELEGEIEKQSKIIDAMSEEICIKRAYAITKKDDIERLKNEIKKEYKNKIKEDPLEMD